MRDHAVSDSDSDGKASGGSPLSIGLFRNFWLATLASNIGGMVQTVGAAWLMTSLSGSTMMVALVQTAANLPIMLLALWAGAIADNFDRRRIMIAAQSFMLIVSVVLAGLSFIGWLSPALILALTFLLACGTAVNWPAMQVATAEMVPRPVLPRAVAFNAMGVNVARSIGPALGGAIISLVGVTLAFVANALSYLGLIGVLARWRYDPAPSPLPRERLFAAMMAGLRYAALSPPILAALGRACAFGLAASAVPALMPLVARDVLQGGPMTFGLLLGAFGLGAVAGALASGRLRERWTVETLMRRACLLMAVGVVIVAASRSIELSLIAFALTGASWLWALSTFNVVIQLSAPRWVVARCLALYQMATYGALALGSWGIGALAASIGTPVALLAAGALLVGAAAIGLRWPLRRLEADLEARTGWSVPDTMVAVDPRSGPIGLAVQHRIAEADIAEFLWIMDERSRILRRDGARRWSIVRDLGDAEIWVERYQLPTWLDYVRLQTRRTRADLDNQARLERMRLGGGAVIQRTLERPADRELQGWAGGDGATTGMAPPP